MLPLILAGPIVRRSSEESILLWLATSQELVLKAEAYIEPLKSPQKLTRVGAGSTVCSIRLGEFLFCQLIEILPANRRLFPETQPVLYDLGLSLKKSSPSSLPLLQSSIFSEDIKKRICFAGEQLPSILLGRSDAPSLRLLYGSCRKIGGLGENPISIAHADMERLLRVRSRRPTALCLVGDQIYADDMLDLTFSEILRLAEQVGGSTLDNPLGNSAQNYKSPGSRGGLVEKRFFRDNKTGFSIDPFKGGNHLVTFHEFAAHYLLATNSALWEQPGGLLEKITDKFPAKSSKPEIEKIERERVLAKTFYEAVSHLTRLMANIPTYMLLDDHEITDDWNLNISWTKRNQQYTLGVDIVRSGLIAYWAFQDIGNRPISCDDPLIGPIKEYFSQSKRKKANEDAVDIALKQRSWGFVTPTNPKVILLDTRTKRVISSIESFKTIGSKHEKTRSTASNTLLVAREEINKLIAGIGDVNISTLVLITPTPVFSAHGIENLKNQIATSLDNSTFPAEYADAENWLSNPLSLYEVCGAMSALSVEQVFVVSGDVHFSFAMNVQINMAGKSFKVAQFTSSALLNEHTRVKKDVLELIGLKFSQSRESQAWWFPTAGGEATLFLDFLNSKAEYIVAKQTLGLPSLEIIAKLEPLHEPLSEVMTIRPPSRAIETRNTIGLLEFCGDFAENRFFSNVNGIPIRSRSLHYDLPKKD